MLEIEVGGARFEARFEEGAAPQTVAAFRRLLPLESSSGEWLAPPFRERTKSIAVGTPAAASTIASWPAPETSSGASGSTARRASSGGPLIATGS